MKRLRAFWDRHRVLSWKICGWTTLAVTVMGIVLVMFSVDIWKANFLLGLTILSFLLHLSSRIELMRMELIKGGK